MRLYIRTLVFMISAIVQTVLMVIIWVMIIHGNHVNSDRLKYTAIIITVACIATWLATIRSYGDRRE